MEGLLYSRDCSGHILKAPPLGHLGGSVSKVSDLAQVMISPFVSWSPTLGSMLTVRSLLGILSLPLSLPLSRSCSFSLPLSSQKK